LYNWTIPDTEQKLAGDHVKPLTGLEPVLQRVQVSFP